MEQREHNSSEHWLDITSDNCKVNETNFDCISSRLKFLLVVEYDSSNSRIYCKVMLPIWFNETLISKVEKSKLSYEYTSEWFFGLYKDISSGISVNIIDLNSYPIILFL